MRSVIVSSACFALLLSACTGSADDADDGVRLVVQGGGGGGNGRVTVQVTAIGKPDSFGSMFFCLTGPGTADIDRVELVGGGDIKLRRFATAPAKAGRVQRLVWNKGPLESLGFPAGAASTVSTPCYPGDPADQYDMSKYATELAVEVERTADHTVSANAVKVHYRIDDREGEVTYPLGITLCLPGDKQTPGCLPPT